MLTGDTIFTSRNRDGTAILRGHPGTRRSIRLDIIAKVVPSFLSYFKVLSNGPPRESNPRPPALQSSALPTELILPRSNLILVVKPRKKQIEGGTNDFSNVYLSGHLL